MGFWYVLIFVIGVALYVKFTFFSKEYKWRFAISIQLTIIGLILIIISIFMFTPISIKLIDLIFPL